MEEENWGVDMEFSKGSTNNGLRDMGVSHFNWTTC
jgi:hypothetical protein